MILYLAPIKGGNPAFASGRRITWKMGEHPHGDMNSCPGILIHEMTHVLDMGSDRVFTEAMADWVRYYRWDKPNQVLDRRYSALRGGRHYGKYASGANFVDFMTQTYGEGTIYNILKGYAKHHDKVWVELYGKTLDDLVKDWQTMQTIYDPAFAWICNGNPGGHVRRDSGACSLSRLSLGEMDVNGACLDGATSGELKDSKCANITIALHGWMPSGVKVAVASLGTVNGFGKAALLATTQKSDMLAAHVIASVPGRGCQVVSTTPVPVQSLASAPHSVILTVKEGDAAVVIIDGKSLVRIDMKTKCDGCTFSPKFAVGGMNGGFGVSGFTEPRGKAGLRLADMRMFARTFRGRETKMYAKTFGPDFRPGIAATAEWTGPAGGDDISSPGNWLCINSAGEKITALPTAETAVSVYGKKLPSIRRGAEFRCKSFTIAGMAIADDDIDLRGVRIVDVEDNSRIITAGSRGIAVNALRADRVRLDGMLAVVTGMKVSGNLEMKEGSVLRLPANPDMAQVKSISIKGAGTVALKPGDVPKRGAYRKLLRVKEMPEDLSRFRLSPSDGHGDATFKASVDGKYIGVTPK